MCTTVAIPMTSHVIVVPGPDTALITKNAVLCGRRAALRTAFGVNPGIAVWTLAAALRVASLARASDVAFTALKLLGAAYRSGCRSCSGDAAYAAIDRVSRAILSGFGIPLALERR